MTVIKEKSDKIYEIAVERIIPNPHQPRLIFDDEKLCLLAESIKQNGIIQPITLRRATGNRYELVSGERRLRAAMKIGMKKIPAVIIDITERNSAVLALVENIQRQDLSFFEEAIAIAKLIDFYGMTQEDAAIKLGKKQSTISNKLRLLRLSPREMTLISEAGLTERHARAFIRISDEETRLSIIEKVITSGLNVEKTEKLIEREIKASKEKENLRRRSVIFGGEVKLFLNTIDKAIETMQAAGINAEMQRKKGEEFIEYKIVIPYVKKG
ncbi:MAG: ParB/RepB/Spo0J family partition protein [Oscillospiraceae bacterium]|nr:ParB/RepB/Spo0J family partition protein [Oscillospiraceae bacterium]